MPTRYVRHTREWLPGSFSQQAGVSRKRKPSKTGACGELSHFLPPCPEDADWVDDGYPFRFDAQSLER